MDLKKLAGEQKGKNSKEKLEKILTSLSDEDYKEMLKHTPNFVIPKLNEIRKKALKKTK